MLQCTPWCCAAASRRARETVGRHHPLTALIRSALQFVACHGLGLALHRQLLRHEVGNIVLAIWLFHAIFSIWWTKRYRCGPMEWLWRSLTYRQRQPLARTPAPAKAPVVD